MSTGALGVPLSALVDRSVCWKEKSAPIPDTRAMLHPVAVTADGLAIATNAVAAVPTCTDRLAGRTAAASAGTHAPGAVSKSNTPELIVPACRHVPEGLMASALIPVCPSPALIAVQVPPPSVVRNTPEPSVPA